MDIQASKGIWIRPNTQSNPSLMKMIHDSKQLRMFDRVWKIEIMYIEDNNVAILSVWATNTIDVIRGKVRNNVFILRVEEEPTWVCEGDLVKGLM